MPIKRELKLNEFWNEMRRAFVGCIDRIARIATKLFVNRTKKNKKEAKLFRAILNAFAKNENSKKNQNRRPIPECQ